MQIIWFVLGVFVGVASQNEQVAEKAFDLGRSTRCAVMDCAE
ncbi:hypothetical protein [Sulfitobacter sp. R18_1]|nr:hypothetical protein [Sulfitobacter sp. R18_1]